ncbi:MAG TPA: YciI family protein [Candidatus Obscuribacterales bacterium]
MQFVVIGRDGTDESASARRMAAREAHLSLLAEMKAAGHVLYAAALTNDDDTMVGSLLICEFASRKQLDAWLKEEPYVTGRVWETVEVQQCKVAPIFAEASLAGGAKRHRS